MSTPFPASFRRPVLRSLAAGRRNLRGFYPRRRRQYGVAYCAAAGRNGRSTDHPSCVVGLFPPLLAQPARANPADESVAATAVNPCRQPPQPAPTAPALHLGFCAASVACLIRHPTPTHPPLPPQTMAGMVLAWWILPIGFAIIHSFRQFFTTTLAARF